MIFVTPNPAIDRTLLVPRNVGPRFIGGTRLLLSGLRRLRVPVRLPCLPRLLVLSIDVSKAQIERAGYAAEAERETCYGSKMNAMTWFHDVVSLFDANRAGPANAEPPPPLDFRSRKYDRKIVPAQHYRSGQAA